MTTAPPKIAAPSAPPCMESAKLPICRECKKEFQRRKHWQKYCGDQCRDAWHGRKRMEKKQSPLSSVAAEQKAGGEIKQNNLSASDTTPRITQSQIRPGTKLAAVLKYLAEVGSLNRFEAERLVHDHCLPSTVAEFQTRFGLRVERREEIVPGFHGHPTRVARYWIADDQREAAKVLLGHE